jgi:hypothetical protein
MEAVLDFLAAAGVWILFILWILALLACPILTLLGLGGNFVIVGLGLVYALATGFDPVGWRLLLVLLGLALLGEGVESLLGLYYVARKGATRYGVVGAFLGGLAGAAVGSGIAPVIGTILGGFLGAYLGAVLGEYWRERNLEPSLRIGMHAFVGKTLASLFKVALAMAMLALLLTRARPF